MKQKERIFIGSFFFLITMFISCRTNPNSTSYKIVSYTVDTRDQDLRLYWKNEKGEVFGSIETLKNHLESQNLTLSFAMNGGMFKEDLSPVGLFIQNGQILNDLDIADGSGNFYLKPNGVFYITKDNTPFICQTSDFKNNGNVKYATQSGPMLIIDGRIHSAFKKDSSNLRIRNGVGILPNKKVVFAISKIGVNFYDFASYFQKLGCRNALYLDGVVSRMWLPEKKWRQTDGNFGVIMGVTVRKSNPY